MAHDAGPGHLRGHVGDADDDVFGAEDGGQPVAGRDAVLQRQHRRLGPDKGRAGARRRLGIPELDREQHRVHRADGGGIVGGVGRMDVHVAARAFDAQTVGADSVEMRAAGDEGHRRAGRRQGRAEDPAEPAGAHDGEGHGRASSRHPAVSRLPVSRVSRAPRGGAPARPPCTP